MFFRMKRNISMFCAYYITVRHIKVISSEFDLDFPKYKESVRYCYVSIIWNLRYIEV